MTGLKKRTPNTWSSHKYPGFINSIELIKKSSFRVSLRVKIDHGQKLSFYYAQYCGVKVRKYFPSRLAAAEVPLTLRTKLGKLFIFTHSIGFLLVHKVSRGKPTVRVVLRA